MRTRLRHVGMSSAFALVVAALAGAAWSASPLPEAVERASQTITAADLRAHLRFLASDELQGRGTGHEGNELAELYLESFFERLALERAAGASYRQPLELYFTTLGAGSELVASERVHEAEVATRYAPGREFQPHAGSASRVVTAGLVFAGYGITAPEYSYDDYAGLDEVARGRIVLALDGEPGNDDPRSRFQGRASTPYAGIAHKIENAKKHGVVGLLLVRNRLRDVKAAWPEQPSVRERDFQLASEVDRETLAIGYVSPDAADRLLADGATPSDRKTAALRDRIGRALESAGKPVNGVASFAVGPRQVRLAVDLTRERVVVHNVLGMIVGDDPKFKDQIVVVGAHLDHDGIDSDGRVFNGADDNASGTVGVLETAEAFAAAARSGRRPARTVVFALWNAEEKGLLGSRYYAEHPVPSGSVVANLTLDMIGRNEEVPDPKDFRFRGLDKTSAEENANSMHLLGYSYSPEFAEIVREENAAVGLTIKESLDVNPQNLIRRSDQWPFLLKRVPVAFFTTGLHPDYHTPQDDVARINVGKLEKIARLAFRVTWRLATDADLPDYVDAHARRPTQ
ncbi:MAG TPA: M28 family peptidase [Vicinamibacterales bacterium]|nr:M28 family peptidase [Vicinamibacterales bacterium]